MAKKSSGFFGLGDLLWIGAGIIAAILFAVPYIVTIAFYAFPLLLGWLKLKAPGGRAPDISEIPQSDGDDMLASLREELEAAEEERRDVLDAGLSDGIRFIDSKGRFENRSNRGQELNVQLSELTESIDELESRIDNLSDTDMRVAQAWRDQFLEWYGEQRYNAAFWAALVAFLAVALFVEVRATAQLVAPLIWNPLPQVLRASLVFGTLAGWIAACVGIYFGGRYYRRKGDEKIAHLISEAGAAENAAEAEEIGDEWREEEPVGDKEEEIGQDWPDVLRVAHDASEHEIRKAYRDAIKRCHPDIVANLSDAIRDAALHDTQRVNAAYERAREARGF